jgi:hypothetical protein
MACSRVNVKELVFYMCIVWANISTLTLPPGMSNERVATQDKFGEGFRRINEMV